MDFLKPIVPEAKEIKGGKNVNRKSASLESLTHIQLALTMRFCFVSLQVFHSTICPRGCFLHWMPHLPINMPFSRASLSFFWKASTSVTPSAAYSVAWTVCKRFTTDKRVQIVLTTDTNCPIKRKENQGLFTLMCFPNVLLCV